MKFLFLAMGLILCLAGAGTYLSFPAATSPLPVLYWTTAANPTRVRTTQLFHEWLIEQGHGERHTLTTMEELRGFRDRRWTDEQRRAIAAGNADGPKVWSAQTREADLPLTVVVPAFELRIDRASHDMRKRVIQGVSGVASDLLPTAGPNVHYMVQIGMIADVTEAARELGFTPEATYETLDPVMRVDGRQYAFPSNVSTMSYMVNKDVFDAVGMDVPPRRWTVQAFERVGKELVARANTPGQRQQVYMADRMPAFWYRTFGVSTFNETLTHCTLDDPRVVRSLELEYKWTYVDHLLPTAAEISSFEVEGGMRGGLFQLIHDGHLAMFNTGRWALIELRRMGGNVSLGFAEPPHDGVPCSLLSGHTIGVYEAGPYKDLAVLFLAYLASEPYSRRVMRIADSLPPRPNVVELAEFKRPPAHPNEWTADNSVHEAFARDARENGISWSISPFVSVELAHSQAWQMHGAVMSRVLSAQEAAADAARRINREIRRSIEEDPALRRLYDKKRAIQDKIDRRRAAGRPVPLAWIDNPYHRELYRRRGWLTESDQPANDPHEQPVD